MNVTQVLAGQQTNLTLTAYSDGTQTDQGTFTIGIVDANGTEVVAPGTAVTDNADGTYSYTLAAQTDPAFLTVTWTESGGDITFTTYVEVVGNVLFTEAAARAFEDGKLADTTKYDDADIAAARAEVTDWLEAQTGRSWVPRYRRATFRGTGSCILNLRHAVKTEGASGGEGAERDITEILSATVNGNALDVDDIDIDGHHLDYTAGVWATGRRPAVVVEYVYGLPHPRNGADRIALLETVDRLVASRLSRAAISSTDELGTYGWDPQNNGRPSRIPEVNAWVRSEDRRVVLA